MQRLASLLKNQENHRMNLARKYEELDKSFAEQSDRLREANIQINTVKEQCSSLERLESQHKIEVSSADG